MGAKTSKNGSSWVRRGTAETVVDPRRATYEARGTGRHREPVKDATTALFRAIHTRAGLAAVRSALDAGAEVDVVVRFEGCLCEKDEVVFFTSPLKAALDADDSRTFAVLLNERKADPFLQVYGQTIAQRVVAIRADCGRWWSASRFVGLLAAHGVRTVAESKYLSLDEDDTWFDFFGVPRTARLIDILAQLRDREAVAALLDFDPQLNTVELLRASIEGVFESGTADSKTVDVVLLRDFGGTVHAFANSADRYDGNKVRRHLRSASVRGPSPASVRGDTLALESGRRQTEMRNAVRRVSRALVDLLVREVQPN